MKARLIAWLFDYLYSLLHTAFGLLALKSRLRIFGVITSLSPCDIHLRFGFTLLKTTRRTFILTNTIIIGVIATS